MSLFNPSFEPGKVFLRGTGGSGAGDTLRVSPLPAKLPYISPAPQRQTLKPEAVRATGTGPFDSAYRQDLATYVGGGFQRPGGMLGLNPTGNVFGNQIGGGNNTIGGLPTDLLTSALGGQGYQANTAPAQSQAPTSNSRWKPGDWRFWLQDYGNKGRNMRMF